MQYESGMLSLESEIEDLYAVSSNSTGGQKAVQELVTGLAAVRPDLEGEDNAR